MPASVVKTPEDEEKWKKAKTLVIKQYPKVKKDTQQYWKLVMGIFLKMTGRKKKQQDNVYSSGTILSQGGVELEQITTTEIEEVRNVNIQRLLKSMKGQTQAINRPGSTPAEISNEGRPSAVKNTKANIKVSKKLAKKVLREKKFGDAGDKVMLEELSDTKGMVYSTNVGSNIIAGKTVRYKNKDEAKKKQQSNIKQLKRTVKGDNMSGTITYECGECGAVTNDTATYCKDCGKEFKPLVDKGVTIHLEYEDDWRPLGDAKEIEAPRFAKSPKMKKLWAEIVKKHGAKATKGSDVNYGMLVAIYKNKGGKIEK